MLFEGVHKTIRGGHAGSPSQLRTTARKALAVRAGGGQGRSQGKSSRGASQMLPLAYVLPATSASTCTINASWHDSAEEPDTEPPPSRADWRLQR